MLHPMSPSPAAAGPGRSAFLLYIFLYIGRMSRRYSIAEARARLSDLVDQAEAGQAVELTRRGHPVAILLSVAEVARLRAERLRFADAYRAFLAQHPLAEVGIEGHLFARVRDRSPGRDVHL
jgi:prevent-host-death family protein